MTLRTAGRALLAAAALATLAGCARGVGPAAAPRVLAGDRQAMIQWHREHDKGPGGAPLAETQPSAPPTKQPAGTDKGD